MTRERTAGLFRRYVLGAATDAERDSIERAYFEHADGLDAVSAAEDDLIDDYLSGRLGRDERERFEHHYLATPDHRRRVAVVRAIRQIASKVPSIERRPSAAYWWTAAGVAAAAVVLIIGVSRAMRVGIAPTDPPVDSRATPTAPAVVPPIEGRGARDESVKPAPDPRAPAATPRQVEPTLVSLSISPILSRGDDEPASITIARGTDTVRLILLGEPEQGRRRGKAIVRTVAGREVWRGWTVTTAASPTGELARIDIPAALVPPDDYIVQLLAIDSTGAGHERYRYFFSVRSP
jgi:hypothetical protein